MGLDRYGRNDLHHAAARGQVPAMQSALDSGQDHSLADRESFTPLHFAAQQGQVEAVRFLLDAGARVDSRDRFGNTALWRATFGNNAVPEIVRTLLTAGADPDAANKSGRSPRDMAATFDKPDIRDLFD